MLSSSFLLKALASWRDEVSETKKYPLCGCELKVKQLKNHSFLIKVEIIEGHIMPDHIHLLLSIPPKYSVSRLWDIWKGKVH